jgi:hypothetical protein
MDQNAVRDGDGLILGMAYRLLPPPSYAWNDSRMQASGPKCEADAYLLGRHARSARRALQTDVRFI